MCRGIGRILVYEVTKGLMQLKRYSIQTVVAWVALSGWLLLLNPEHTPIYLLVVPFLLLYVAIYRLWLVVGLLWLRLVKAEPRSERASRQTGKLVALFICALVILSSLGQLVARDVITLFLLFIVGYFYILRSRKQDADK